MKPHRTKAPDPLFFQELWENLEPADHLTSPKHWNMRADGWIKKLEERPVYREKELGRVQATRDFLLGQDLIGPGKKVLDIGCGPGLFATEFAKTAEFVTGLDLSPRMARHAAAYARAQGQDNTRFIALDFREADLQTLGGARAYDLVMSSLTPAISGLADLYKMMSLSRDSCLHVSFVETRDSLRAKMIRDLYGHVDQKGGHWDGRVFYSVFNLLFWGGYYPVTSYFTYNKDGAVELDDDLIDRYTSMLSKELMGVDVSREAIQEYLEAINRKKGHLTRQTSENYGFILWNVNKKRNTTNYAKELS
ncbi:MAG: methyltransferase domain-containing protein [Clostridiaceae bacterium]|nr:methyltransferase domain-containing protein [Clostridiaceae bacterium]